MKKDQARQTSSEGVFSHLRSDFLSSVVVFLVALPLCMGIAIASGAPVATGLITGIVGGLVVGWLAGCPLQVSGPAAGLTVIVYDIIQTYGLESLGLIVLLAGVMQMAAGAMRLGQWFRAVSPAVIKGMLAGIGFLILGSQFHVMIDDRPKGSGAENLATIPQAIVKSIAVPELSSRDVRQFRIDALRQIGELHRQQVAIQERVGENAPHSEGAHQTDLTPVPSAAAMASLAQRQQAIASRLEQVAERVAEFDQASPATGRAEEIRGAVEAALAQNRAAVAALQTGEIEPARAAQAEAVAALNAALGSLKNHHVAAYIGVFTIVLLILWRTMTPQRLRVVPAPLVAVVAATFGAILMALPVIYVEVPDRLWEDIRLPLIAAGEVAWPQMFQAALLMAVVASAETLLCASAVDQMHHGSRTNYDRELFAQGVGNTVCGVLGALPMTGVIVRSSANVQAGAKTRFSSILHGAWLLLFVAALGFVLRLIPTASLAAILVYTGYKLIDVKALRDLRRYGWGEVAIYAATVGMIVFTDLLTGVLVGVGLSAAKLLYTVSHLSAKMEVNVEARSAVLRLRGAATFVSLPRLAAHLDQAPRGVELHVDFEHLDYIDHACLDLLMNWAKQHASTGGSLVLDWDSLHARFHRDRIDPSRRRDDATSETPPTAKSDSSLLQDSRR